MSRNTAKKAIEANEIELKEPFYSMVNAIDDYENQVRRNRTNHVLKIIFLI